MSSAYFRVCMTAWLAVVVLGPGLLAAENPPAAEDDAKTHQQGAQKVPPINLTGTVIQAGAGGVSLTSPTNETWHLRIPHTAKVEVTGTADPEMLRPGAFVRLSAIVDTRKNLIAEPVNQLTLLDGLPPVMPGLGASQPSGEQVLLDLVGQIKSTRAGQIVLEVPNQKATIRFELADSATVAISVSDYTLAKPGDTIVAKGGQLTTNMAEASEVSITLSTPISDGKKRPEPARPASSPRRSAGGEQRNAFDVAGQMEQGGAEPMTQPTPPTTQPAAAPAIPASSDGPTDLVAMLTPEPGSSTWPNIRVRLGDAPPVAFIPCKPVTRAELRQRFGQPNKVFDLSGELPVGPDRSRKAVRWEMWLFGDVRVFLDETGMARYRQAR
ncbi:MAG: hypothetical protein U1E05_05125 [Patescibacteria group bacterium]|nr:hypothetical protein [Patescibacteria group bacterium]